MGGMANDKDPGPDDDDRVPIFGSWQTIYRAVIATTVVVMVLVALFSQWPF